jgi:hypothetical protein
MKIYIPTFRRVDKQITFNNLPDKYKESVVMVVQEQERDLYNYDCEYMVVDDNIGLTKTRTEIFKNNRDKKFCMVDDDVTFWRRNQKYIKEVHDGYVDFKPNMKKVKTESDMDRSKRLMEESDFDEMFTEFDDLFDNGDTYRPDQPIIQVSCREQSKPPVGIRTRTNLAGISFQFFNGVHIDKIFDDIDWNMVKVGQDSMWQLEFLLHGYQLRMSDIFCIKSLWWQEGGVSEYRDAKMYDEEHRKLIKKYPKYCYNDQKTIKRDKIGDVIDIRYRWRKAFIDGSGVKL